MQILLTAATDFEIAPFKHRLKANDDAKSKANKHEIDFLNTGIGIPSTVYRLTNHLLKTKKKYHIVINAGIAGAFTSKFAIGQVVNVVQDEFADIGIDDKGIFTTLFEQKLLSFSEKPFTKGKLFNNSDTNLLSNIKIENARAITVNTTSGSQQRIETLRRKFQPDIETMEGAAFMYVCLSENIPFLQIRAVSNRVEVRNIANWDIQKAISNLNSSLICIFE